MLLGETFLTREPGSGTRLLTERFLDQIGDGRVVETLEFGSNETIKQGVMAGLGVALISGHTVAGEIETGRLALVCLPGLPIMRSWFVVTPREREQSPATATLAGFLVERREDYLPRADMFAAYICP
jgi:DNA-binding transcriptional LysR family regulator